MPGTGNYPTPYDPSSIVASQYVINVDDALYKLKDNNNQEIDPKDIRDSVWTLWNRIDDVQITASQSLSYSSNNYYSNTNPTTAALGGIAAGTTFGASYSMQQMFDMLLYPYTAPVPSLSISGLTTRQFGDSLVTTLNWGVTKKKLTITGITVNSTTITPITGLSQTGTLPATATYSTNYGNLASDSCSFSMSVTDGQTTQTATTTITWRHRMYWGKLNILMPADGSKPDLTITPGSVAVAAAACTDAAIKSLGNSDLVSSYIKTFTNFNCSDQYFVVAWPTIFGANPKFFFGTNLSPVFTKVKSNSPFVTDTGLTINYDIWVSNTKQQNLAELSVK
jgi:hypothetical protein